MTRHGSSGRRRFLHVTGGAALAALAGCSQTETGQTPEGSGDAGANAANGEGDATTTEATSTTTEATSTTTDAAESATSCETPSDGKITTLAEYECVTANQEEWLGHEVASTGRVGQRYQEDYVIFKHQLASKEELVLPFFVKTAREFTMGTTYAFSGTIEKFADVQGKPVMYLENPTFEKQN